MSRTIEPTPRNKITNSTVNIFIEILKNIDMISKPPSLFFRTVGNRRMFQAVYSLHMRQFPFYTRGLK
jgi:hypothetical protein